MALDDDLRYLRFVLRWIGDVLGLIVHHIPEGDDYQPLTMQLHEALPSIRNRLDDAAARLQGTDADSVEWQRLSDRGLTGDQLRWKLTLLDKLFEWSENNTALTRRLLRWINNFLESFGLDAVKEFKEGVEMVIEHQRKPRWLPPIFPPEEWPWPKR